MRRLAPGMIIRDTLNNNSYMIKKIVRGSSDTLVHYEELDSNRNIYVRRYGDLNHKDKEGKFEYEIID